MNFLNFLTSGASLFNLNLQQTSQTIKKDNHILVNCQENRKSNLADYANKSQQIPMTTVPNANQSKQQQLSRMLLTQQQLLISQFLQLNYLKNCHNLSTTTSFPSMLSTDKNENEDKAEIQRVAMNKKIKKYNRCGHQDRAHYAKGMCNNCYHKHGRTKKPWNCSHSKLYAGGMCQNCYINNYNRKKREEKNIVCMYNQEGQGCDQNNHKCGKMDQCLEVKKENEQQ